MPPTSKIIVRGLDELLGNWPKTACASVCVGSAVVMKAEQLAFMLIICIFRVKRDIAGVAAEMVEMEFAAYGSDVVAS
jgi:hypothetical protein